MEHGQTYKPTPADRGHWPGGYSHSLSPSPCNTAFVLIKWHCYIVNLKIPSQLMISKIKNHRKSYYLRDKHCECFSKHYPTYLYRHIQKHMTYAHRVWSSVIMHDLYVFVLNLKLNAFSSLSYEFEHEEWKPNKIWSLIHNTFTIF